MVTVRAGISEKSRNFGNPLPYPSGCLLECLTGPNPNKFTKKTQDFDILGPGPFGSLVRLGWERAAECIHTDIAEASDDSALKLFDVMLWTDIPVTTTSVNCASRTPQRSGHGAWGPPGPPWGPMGPPGSPGGPSRLPEGQRKEGAFILGAPRVILQLKLWFRGIFGFSNFRLQ